MCAEEARACERAGSADRPPLNLAPFRSSSGQLLTGYDSDDEGDLPGWAGNAGQLLGGYGSDPGTDGGAGLARRRRPSRGAPGGHK